MGAAFLGIRWTAGAVAVSRTDAARRHLATRLDRRSGHRAVAVERSGDRPAPGRADRTTRHRKATHPGQTVPVRPLAARLGTVFRHLHRSSGHPQHRRVWLSQLLRASGRVLVGPAAAVFPPGPEAAADRAERHRRRGSGLRHLSGPGHRLSDDDPHGLRRRVRQPALCLQDRLGRRPAAPAGHLHRHRPEPVGHVPQPVHLACGLCGNKAWPFTRLVQGRTARPLADRAGRADCPVRGLPVVDLQPRRPAGAGGVAGGRCWHCGLRARDQAHLARANKQPLAVDRTWRPC